MCNEHKLNTYSTSGTFKSFARLEKIDENKNFFEYLLMGVE